MKFPEGKECEEISGRAQEESAANQWVLFEVRRISNLREFCGLKNTKADLSHSLLPVGTRRTKVNRISFSLAEQTAEKGRGPNDRSIVRRHYAREIPLPRKIMQLSAGGKTNGEELSGRFRETAAYSRFFKASKERGEIAPTNMLDACSTLGTLNRTP